MRLRGSYVPLVTPFREGAVDYPAYARLVENQVASGSHGVVVAGTTGAPTSLSLDERERLLEVALEAAQGRIGVVAATGSQSHEDTLRLTRHAERAGAEAVLVVTPYFSQPPERGLVEYFVDVAGRTALPVLVYHIPGRASVEMKPEALARVAERAKNLVGVKHAARDLEFVTEILARLGPDFRVFCGLESLSLPMLVLGAHGLMNAVGNLAGGPVARLYQAVVDGDLRAARALHDHLSELNRAVFFEVNPIPMKYMMARLGLLATDEHRLPLVPPTPEVAARLDGVLRRAGLLPAG